MRKDNKKKVKCPNCESSWVMYRDGDKTFLCRSCGNRWKKKKECN